MTLSVRALCALVFCLGFVACSDKPQVDPSFEVVEASAPGASDRMVAEVEKKFSDFKRMRDTSVGWASEVRPGDRRSTNGVEDDLMELFIMDKLIGDAPDTDKVGALRSGIRELMIEDCKLLLRKARSEQDIWALGQFVRHSQNLDVSLETDFGVKPDVLRKEALVMARKEVLELRPRIKEGSGDAIGGLQILYNKWQFTREELGLTAEEAKLLTER